MNFKIPLRLVYWTLEKTVGQLNPLQANLLTGVSKLKAIKTLNTSSSPNSVTQLNNSERLRRTIFPLKNLGRQIKMMVTDVTGLQATKRISLEGLFSELNQRVMIPRSNKVTLGSFERQNEVF